MNILRLCLVTVVAFAGLFSQLLLGAADLELKQWDVGDLSFRVSGQPPKYPFDVTFGAVFESDDGERMQVSGFYNGEHEWLLRFSGNRPATWTYTTFSSEASLSGMVGKVVVTSDKRPGKRGALIIHPDSPQHFQYEDGSAFFGTIYELDWLFALDARNPEGLQRTAQIIADIKANGFNQVVMNVFAYESRWKKSEDVPERYDYRRPEIFPWKGTNAEPDFSELNVAFFKHLDRVIQHLDDNDILSHLMIYTWNKQVNWPEMYSKADNQYYDYVVKRYQAFPNIIWDPSKEALDYGRCDIPYINERVERIRKLDAFGRLLTVHDYEYNSREGHRVDFISIQSWRPNLYDLMLKARQAHPDKPVVNIEHGGYEEGPYLSFEGNYVNAEQILIRAYACVFAGVYPSYYWQNTAWDFIIYDALKAGNDFPQPSYRYYRYMKELFDRYPFENLFPVEQKLTTNDRRELDNLSTGGLPLTDGKGLVLYYVPGTTYQINTVLPRPESGRLAFEWFNIFTGEFTETEELDWSGWGHFKSPWRGVDSVLIVRQITPLPH